MAWEGYFFKLTRTNVEFDKHFIQWDSYLSTPNQREEIKAYRDENTRDLHRVTAPGMKSKIEFTTLPFLSYTQKCAIQDFFRSSCTADEWKERKVQLTYWNDEDNTYYTAYFYIPDIQFKIHHLDENGYPVYNSLDIHLIEY